MRSDGNRDERNGTGRSPSRCGVLISRARRLPQDSGIFRAHSCATIREVPPIPDPQIR